MNLPDKQLLRYGEVKNYLGVTKRTMVKLVEGKVLNPVLIGGKGRAFYTRTEVLAAGTAKGIQGAAAGASAQPIVHQVAVNKGAKGTKG